MRTGKRLGEVLIERGWIAERISAGCSRARKACRTSRFTAADAQPDALRALPEQNARLQVALPLHYEGAELVVAVADPSNELVIENLRRRSAPSRGSSSRPQGSSCARSARPTQALVPRSLRSHPRQRRPRSPSRFRRRRPSSCRLQSSPSRPSSPPPRLRLPCQKSRRASARARPAAQRPPWLLCRRFCLPPRSAPSRLPFLSFSLHRPLLFRRPSGRSLPHPPPRRSPSSRSPSPRLPLRSFRNSRHSRSPKWRRSSRLRASASAGRAGAAAGRAGRRAGRRARCTRCAGRRARGACCAAGRRSSRSDRGTRSGRGTCTGRGVSCAGAAARGRRRREPARGSSAAGRREPPGRILGDNAEASR